MSNNYAPCFNKIDFVVISSHIELPCSNSFMVYLATSRDFPEGLSNASCTHETEFKHLQNLTNGCNQLKIEGMLSAIFLIKMTS